MLLRAGPAKAKNLLATVEDSQREIACINAKLDANAQVFADL